MKPLAWSAALLAILGCSSGPSRIEPPSIDADDAASQAMEMFDKDGDGSIAGSELDAAPALKASMATLDTNKDDAVQEDEIVQRIESWQATGAGITSISVLVTMNGRPLDNAEITFEPTPFLGNEVKPAVGLTSPRGITSPTILKENRPTPDTPAGMQYGFYRVRISKKSGGTESIPAKYNAKTELTADVTEDADKNKFDYALTAN